jgi:hypothetical protein
MRSPRLNAMGRARRLAGAETHLPLPSVGRPGLRPRPLTIKIRTTVNDSKNDPRVVLSALVLLGWTWAANKFSRPPTRRAPRSRTARQAAAPAAGRRPRPHAPQRRCAPAACSARRRACGSRRRRSQGLDQPQGRADRRPRAGPPARDDRQEFAAGAAAVAGSARRAPISRLRLDRRGRRRARRQHVWTASAPT